MRIDLMTGAALALLVTFSSAIGAEDSDIELLQSAIDELRIDYDARIADLERRLAVAEQNAMQANYAVPEQLSASGSGASAFNPAIGVIFSGKAWTYARDPENYFVQGFSYGGEAGPISEGLSLGETEIVMSANVDDKFSALITAALAIEDGEAVVEVEEAWVEANSLPGGLGAKFGRFFSGIGYLNGKHAHGWDFADQPLPYQAFLAGQLRDDGIQVRWLAPTEFYLELGAEALRGGSYPASGAAHKGFGTYSLFANLGGDVGPGGSWLAGFSYLNARAIDRPSGDADDPLLFTGDSDLMIAHLVWKWSENGNWKDRNLVVQAEYLQRSLDGVYGGSSSSPSVYKVDQNGWYAQAVYQPFPRWRIGGRIDTLSSDMSGSAFDGTILASPLDDPRRISLMADWANSEFSRLRLQMTWDEAGPVDDYQWGIQYFHSIGAHGAHTF